MIHCLQAAAQKRTYEQHRQPRKIRFKSCYAHHFNNHIDNKGDCQIHKKAEALRMTFWHNNFKFVQSCARSIVFVIFYLRHISNRDFIPASI